MASELVTDQSDSPVRQQSVTALVSDVGLSVQRRIHAREGKMQCL